jgi:hypothetical protein
MDDEAYKSWRLQKEQFKALAKNPTDDVTLYRLQAGDGDSLGIHWSTDPGVAHHTGLGRRDQVNTVHRATASKGDIIREGEWKGRNIRSYAKDDPTASNPHKSQWGLDSEAEVRLRPGATVRDHATAPAGDESTYTPSGREPTIEDRGSWNHIDIAHAAVQGTPEANRLHSIQGGLGHKQQSMFDTVHEDGTDRLLGHIPKMNLLPGSIGERIDQTMADSASVARAAGHADEWSHNVETGREPMLSELRAKPAAAPEPQVHKRVASQAQFQGMEGF